MTPHRAWAAILGVAALAACASLLPPESRKRVDPYDWRLPAGFPPPPVPRNNPMAAAKVELGRRLFYDSRLSRTGESSCSSCHLQELAFTDGRARAMGATGEIHPRSAMTLTNVAYQESYNWADSHRTTLEAQARNPIFNEDPVELGLSGYKPAVLQRFSLDAAFMERFVRVFPGRRLTIGRLIEAIAAFERTLVSGNSPYDRFVFFEEALPDPAKRGMELFYSERMRCSECHRGLNFTGPGFHNTGLFDLDGRGAYPAPNRGLFEHSGKSRDMGRFRAPTLRNIAVTAPYMHDGSLLTLRDVVQFYAAGGRGAGRKSPLKSSLVGGFELSPSEEAELISFLESLTDQDFLEDRRYGPPGQKLQLKPAE